MRLGRLSVIISVFLLPLFAKAQQSKSSSAELYRIYVIALSTSPISEADFANKFIPYLKDKGFSTSGNTSWKMRDDSGSVEIYADIDSGLFVVDFNPSRQTPFGDAALSGLIQRASSVGIEAGDTIAVNLIQRELHSDGRKGTQNEVLLFSLKGGLWLGTRSAISWPKEKESK